MPPYEGKADTDKFANNTYLELSIYNNSRLLFKYSSLSLFRSKSGYTCI